MPTKPSFRKKVIMPISPEADILAASAIGRRRTLNVTATSQPALHSPTTTHTPKASTEPTRALASANKHTPLTSGSEARINSEIELELLSSGLDRKNRRLKEILAFLAQVLLWAAATYVIFL